MVRKLIATVAPMIILLANTDARAQIEPTSSGESHGPRIGIQGRLDALNILGADDASVRGLDLRGLFVPIVAPGVRFKDGRLYLGLGVAFAGQNDEEPNGDESSRSAFSLDPVVTYDFLVDQFAALYVVGWLNLISVGDEEVCEAGDCRTEDNGYFGWGLNIGAGVRGNISPGLGIGAEFGWGFLSTDDDDDDNHFFHGIFGAIVFEASVGI